MEYYSTKVIKNNFAFVTQIFKIIKKQLNQKTATDEYHTPARPPIQIRVTL